jgi:hypothetical protein
MVHFFGILSPDFGKRTEAPDAPNKTEFFGGLPDFSFGAVPLSRAEQDACYLAGKGPSRSRMTAHSSPDLLVSPALSDPAPPS